MSDNRVARTAVVIDGKSMAFVELRLRKKFDYAKILDWLKSLNRFVTSITFYVQVATDDSGFASVERLLCFLENNGYTVVRVDNSTAALSTYDARISVDICSLAENVDEIILVSHSRSISPVGKAITERGAKFTLVSTRKGSLVSTELLFEATEFIDFDTADIFREDQY